VSCIRAIIACLHRGNIGEVKAICYNEGDRLRNYPNIIETVENKLLKEKLCQKKLQPLGQELSRPQFRGAPCRHSQKKKTISTDHPEGTSRDTTELEREGTNFAYLQKNRRLKRNGLPKNPVNQPYVSCRSAVSKRWVETAPSSNIKTRLS